MARPKIRSNGEGSIFQCEVRGQRVWRAAFSVPYLAIENGEEVRKWRRITGTSSSKTEAIARRQALFERFTGQLDAAGVLAGKQRNTEGLLTVSDLLDQWLAAKSAYTEGPERIGANVARMYARAIELHIRPALGDHFAIEVTRHVLSHFLLDTLSSKTNATGEPLLGNSPKRMIRNILTMAWGWGVREELLISNPTLDLPRFFKPKRKNEQLQRKRWMVQKILKRIEGTPEEAYWILAFHGVRQSERLGVTFGPDGSFTNLNGKDKQRPTRLEIKQQLWRNPVEQRLEIKPDLKTESGERIIPLDSRVAKVLNEQMKRQLELRKSPEWNPPAGMENLLFSMPDGRPVSQVRDNKRWHALFERIVNENHRDETDPQHVPVLRGHALRHIAISTLIETGTPIEVVRVLAGHSVNGGAGGDITRAVYTHLSWTSGTAPMQGLAEILYRDADGKGH